jgi:hypothetical protein
MNKDSWIDSAAFEARDVSASTGCPDSECLHAQPKLAGGTTDYAEDAVGGLIR